MIAAIALLPLLATGTDKPLPPRTERGQTDALRYHRELMAYLDGMGFTNSFTISIFVTNGSVYSVISDYPFVTNGSLYTALQGYPFLTNNSLTFVPGSNVLINGGTSPVLATNGKSFLIDVPINTNQAVANTSLLISYTDTATAEANNFTGTNVLYSTHIASNGYSLIKVDSTFVIRNTTGSAHGYRVIVLQQPDGGGQSALVSLTSALQTGGNNPGFVDGNAALAPLSAFSSSLANGGTISMAVELDSANTALGATMLNFRAVGIK